MCKHIVAFYSYYNSESGVYTKQELCNILKEDLYNKWLSSFSEFGSCFDYCKSNFLDTDFRINYNFFNFCPECGAKLNCDEIFDEINSTLSKYLKSLKKLEKPVIPDCYGFCYNKNNKKSNKGCVYLVKLDKHYKIGVSRKPKERLKEFTLLPYKLEEIIIKNVEDYLGVEKYLHKKYKDFRIRGEWFEFSPKQVEDIKNYLERL